MNGFKDQSGIIRHTLTFNELRELYRKLDDFIADCTHAEIEANKIGINVILAMIHKRMIEFENSTK